jgi:hypothetical protein
MTEAAAVDESLASCESCCYWDKGLGEEAKVRTALTLLAAGLVAALVAAGGTLAVTGKHNLQVMTVRTNDTLPGGVARGFNANCPAGWVLTGGGWEIEPLFGETSTQYRVLRDRPVDNQGSYDGGGWQIVAANLGTLGDPNDDLYVSVWAICAQLP